MRSFFLAFTVALVPALAGAEPQCNIAPAGGVPAFRLPQAVTRVDSPEPAPAVAAASIPDDALPPALSNVAGAGAQIIETGAAHGMRSVVARNGQQFMFMHVTPDGQAIVACMISELTPAQLTAAAAGQTRELGTSHGLRGIFVSNGNQFQVFYVTPDGERVIPGAMWDGSGNNLTRNQVTPIPGAIATVEIGPGATEASVDAAAPRAASALAWAQSTTAGTLGDPAAPKVWVFIDPMCSFSVRAMQQLHPLIEARILQVAAIPLSILDAEDNGRSTPSALSMLSQPPDQMVSAWAGGRLNAPPSPEAPARLAANMAAAESIGLRGTPTLVWRKADGSEGRSDGMPSDLNAFVASLGR